MNTTREVHRLFSGLDADPRLTSSLYADSRLWYAWQKDRGTTDSSYEQTMRELGLPVVRFLRPWNIVSNGGIHTFTETDTEKRRRFGIGERILEGVWQKGPDGDFWQTGYPVKSTDDLDTLIGYLETRSFLFDEEIISNSASAGDDLTLIELPARPFSWLMLEILGWSEGLMLLMDSGDRIEIAMALAEGQVADITRRICESSNNAILLSPDNLDAQFVSPGFFDMYLDSSYRRLNETASESGNVTVVHTGGPIRTLVEPLAATGISALAGVSEKPQGDAGPARIRELSNGSVVPWGGIPQDVLMPNIGEQEAIETVDACLEEISGCDRALIGIADHIPIEATPDRIRAVAERVNRR